MSFSKIKEVVGEDGKGHVRLFHRAETKQGILLSVNCRIPFRVKGAGRFASAQCFVNWLHTGVEEARYNHKLKVKGLIVNYFEYILYAKYLQLKDRVDELKSCYNPSDNFVMYKVHSTGVREVYDWRGYTRKITKIADSLVSSKETSPYGKNWPANIDQKVEELILKIGGLHSGEIKLTEFRELINE